MTFFLIFWIYWIEFCPGVFTQKSTGLKAVCKWQKKSGKWGAGISVKLFENGLSNNASEHVLLFHLDKNGLLHLSQNYTLNLSQPDPKLSQGAQPAVLMSCENLTIERAISKFFTKATWWKFHFYTPEWSGLDFMKFYLQVFVKIIQSFLCVGRATWPYTVENSKWCSNLFYQMLNLFLFIFIFTHSLFYKSKF